MTRALWAFGLAIAVFALDQGSKYWAWTAYDLPHQAPVRVASFLTVHLDFVFARNTGVNFGLFSDGGAAWQAVLIGVAVAISGALGYWALRTRDLRVAAGCALVVGGALGNAVDRAWFGGVFDFVNVDCCGVENPYAFNLADAAIFLGAVIIAVYARFGPEAGSDPVDDRRP